jgi:hypothetical protein
LNYPNGNTAGNVSPAGSLALHPTFCGQNFLDAQENISYTAAIQKEVLININQ